MADAEPSSGHQGANSGGDDGASDSTVNNTVRSTTAKDRQCPFCHQAFTSSSLGRHLDTYIRAKNPKAPDGIHDVAEIRKIRGNITRRHARVSSNSHTPKRASSSPFPIQRGFANGNTPPQPVQPPVQPQPPVNNYTGETTHPVFSRKGKADWTATGVINDLPPRTSATPASRELPLPGPDINTNANARNYEEHDEMENARAAELALKEVLRSIKDAASRTTKQPLFDFDPLVHNFPALCLRMLPAPPSLFSTTPATADGSWPLEPPTQSTLTAIHRHLSERLDTHQRGFATVQSSDNGAQDARRPSEDTRADVERYAAHVENSYAQWSQLPDSEKQRVWNLELMRAFAEESRKRHSAQQGLQGSSDEVARLRSQLDSYFRQQPTLQFTRSPARVPQSIVRDLVDMNVDLREWDYDKLVAKWKHTLRPRRSWAWTNPPRQPAQAPTPAAVQASAPAALQAASPAAMQVSIPAVAALGAEEYSRGDVPFLQGYALRSPKRTYSTRQTQSGTSMQVPPQSAAGQAFQTSSSTANMGNGSGATGMPGGYANQEGGEQADQAADSYFAIKDDMTMANEGPRKRRMLAKDGAG